MSDYAEKLRDPRWQKKRLEILQRDNWTCLDCGSTTNTLVVHHTIYKPGHEPWEYDKSLKTICEVCHDREHNCGYFEDDLLRACLSRYLTMDERNSLFNGLAAEKKSFINKLKKLINGNV